MKVLVTFVRTNRRGVKTRALVSIATTLGVGYRGLRGFLGSRVTEIIGHVAVGIMSVNDNSPTDIQRVGIASKFDCSKGGRLNIYIISLFSTARREPSGESAKSIKSLMFGPLTSSV